MCGVRAAEELWRRQNLINLSKKLEIFWHIYLPLNLVIIPRPILDGICSIFVSNVCKRT